MNLIDIASQHNKDLFSSIRSKMVLYSIDQGDSNEGLSEHLSVVSSLMEKAHEFIVKNTVDLSQENFRIYSKNGLFENEYYILKPHLSLGYSPFVFFKKDNQVKGMYISIRQVKNEWCKKTKKRLADRYFEEKYKNDDYVTRKEASLHVEENLAKNNKDKIPLLEKYTDITFYFDVERGRVLAKSSQRDREAMDVLYSLFIKAVSQEELADLKIKDICVESMRKRLNFLPYTRKAMSDGDACSAYDLNSLVTYYSDKFGDELPLEPTWSAQLYFMDDTSQKVSFGRSINLFLDKPCDVESLPSFSQINEFADGKDLRFSEIRVKGELTRGELIAAYCEAYGEENELSSSFYADYVDVLYSTQAKEGNICIQIKDNLEMHKEALSAMLRSEIRDTHLSKVDFEFKVAEYQGRTLDVLHNSIGLFESLYLRFASVVNEEFGEKTRVDRILEGDMSEEPLKSENEALKEAS
tara:strand:- start:5050 stop:6453 length:1404 start_codon:yes stop_codon:yes gene_type:complete